MFKAIKIKIISLLRGEFEYRTLIYLMSGTVVVFLGLTLLIGNSIAHFYFERLRNQEIEFLFRAIEAGPLSFARLQSVEVSQQALTRLMTGDPQHGPGAYSIELRGGLGFKYSYGSWKRAGSELSSECKFEIQRDFSYSDSMNPFRVEIKLDSCRAFNGFSGVRLMSVVSVFLLSSIMMVVLMLVFWPLFRSIKNAEILLKAGGQSADLRTIPFLPIRRLGSLVIQEFQREKDLAQVRVAQQVAHDVRSPLVALEMISSQLNEIHEEKRVIIKGAIRSIRDIANLLRSSAVKSETDQIRGATTKNHESILLYPVLDELISEKRFEFKNAPEISLEFDQTADFYGLAARVDSIELKRVISNLINNSFEALSGQSGRVELRLARTENFTVSIEVVDQGRGMTEAVLAQIGNRGVSVGKNGGTGLGLAHAKDFARTNGGELRISSKIGRGTRVTLTLPAAEAPNWLAQQLTVKSGATIIVLDDEPTLYEVWRKRIEEVPNQGERVEIKSVMTTAQLQEWLRHEYLDLDQPLFLMDYEISGGSGKTGLDLISELGIGSQSCLVTSHYQETSVIEKCQRLGVKVIPKSMSRFVPINID